MLVTRPFTNVELCKQLEDLAARHFAPGDSSVDRGLIAEAARRLTEAGWLPIATAPRDGKNVLLRFGEDGVSQGKYIPGLPHPWLFIDTNDGITWLLNHAVDGPGGPSHWQALPSERETLQAESPSHAAEPLVRFCPGCGSVGEIGDGYRGCCPGGNEARMIPEKLAGKCHDLFESALRGVLAERGVTRAPIDRQALIDWIASRWRAEVGTRPLANVHRRALDDTWRQMLRHLGVDDHARLGPAHDELCAAGG